MVATVVAPTTVAVAAASLGDFAVAAAAVKLEDVAGSRRRRAVVARVVVGRAVGGCAGRLSGWRWGHWGRAKDVVAAMNSAGVGRNFVEIYRTSMLTQTRFLWVTFGLNHSVMGKTEAFEHWM